MSHDEILNIVCRELSVSIEDVKSTTRKKRVLYARKLSVYYLNNEVPEPYIIAGYFDSSIKSIYRYRSNFHKELRYNRALRYLKSRCDLAIKKGADSNTAPGG
ncbi:helix-turn-helix domain-containing protein [Dysgonomonas sp.]